MFRVKTFAKFYHSYAVKQESIHEILTKNFEPVVLDVEDISGGCGSMFKVFVVSPKFEGKSMLQQHKMVQETLKEEISQMHGMTLTTKTPSQYKPE
jgi:stress-induced morphogen